MYDIKVYDRRNIELYSFQAVDKPTELKDGSLQYQSPNGYQVILGLNLIYVVVDSKNLRKEV